MSTPARSSAWVTLQPDITGETERGDGHQLVVSPICGCLITFTSYSCMDFFFFFYSFCLAESWKRTVNIKYDAIEFYHNFCDECLVANICVCFPSSTPPTYSALGALGPGLGYLLSAQGSLNLFCLFFLLFCVVWKQMSDAAGDSREVQDLLGTPGLKGNNRFLPTRLERVNFGNLQAQQWAN